MILRTLRTLPKLALALAMLIISTTLFGVWWMFFKPTSVEESKGPTPEQLAARQAALDEIKAGAGSLFVADGNLMDMNTGKVLLNRWLGLDKPLQIWLDSENGKFICRYPQGFKRYDFDGTGEVELGKRFGVQVSDDLSLAVFPTDGDIWTSGIDWKAFDFVNPRRITTIGGFQDAFVLQNIMLASKKAMIISNMNQLVRVDLESGGVAPVQIPFTQAPERRSPDGGILAGEVPGSKSYTVFMYDVEANDAKKAEVGMARINSTLWLGRERCCLLINSQNLLGYDRAKGTFAEIMKLPKPFNKIAAASPTGRFIFCLDNNGVGIADLEKKEMIPVNFPPQNLYWIGDDTLLMSRDITDSTYRGTWVQELGGEALRVSTEPYVYDDTNSSVLLMKEAGMVIFGIKNGLVKMKPDGSSVNMFASIPYPALRIQKIEIWDK